MSIPVKLCVYHKKFEVVSQYDSDLVKFCLSIPKGYYDRINQVWRFPISELDNVINFVKSKSKFSLDIKSKDYNAALMLALDDYLHFNYNWKANTLDQDFLEAFKLAFPKATTLRTGSNEWCLEKKDYGELKKFLQLRNIESLYISDKILPFLDYIYQICRQPYVENFDRLLKQTQV